VVLPQRFVSVVFDDVHLSMQDATFVRDSATRLLALWRRATAYR